MIAELLERSFTKMGARVKFGDSLPGRGRALSNLTLDVREDGRGEYFLIQRAKISPPELVVLDVQPKEHHLLLLSRNGLEKHRFLLGHDERHWFVAGIPETTPVSRVRDAKRALKPEAVLISERRLRQKDRDRRTNAARIRQGSGSSCLLR